MKKSVIILVVLSLATSAFAGGYRGHGGGRWNPWQVAGAALLTYGGVQVINSLTGSSRAVYTTPVVVEQPNRSYSYGGCNGSVEYCRGLAEAERRRYEEYRRMEYERGLRDGMR